MPTTTPSSPSAKQPRLSVPPSPTADDRLLKARELQTTLGLSRGKVYRLMRDGTLPTVRIGNSIRVPLKALLAWIDRLATPTKTT